MEIKLGLITDKGRKRKINEDSLLADKNNNLYVVADGMGGHHGGELASIIATDTLKDFFDQYLKNQSELPYPVDDDFPYISNLLYQSFYEANKRILNKAQELKQFHDMGTTTTAITFYKKYAYVCHIGDSRVYLFRKSKLHQITFDHSFSSEYQRKNSTKKVLMKNVLLKALGTEDKNEPDLFSFKIEKGDMFLLSSDGLTNMLSDNSLRKILNSNGNNLQECANILLASALEKGGLDNITAIILKII